MILLFAFMAVGVVAIGYLYYLRYERQYRVQVEHQLLATSELKVGEIAEWRRERLGYAKILFKNTAFSAMVRRFHEQPEDAQCQQTLHAWLTALQVHGQYDQVRLLDPQGVTRMSVSADLPPLSAAIMQSIPDVLRGGEVAFQDFYRDEQDQKIYLAVMVPILDEQDGARRLGVVILRIDPATFIFPHLQQWPTPSRTAETLLVRKDGNGVIFLNELKFQKDTALTLRIPLADTDQLAVKAALGKQGIVEGLDYRGAPVIGYARGIPGSSWFLVARIDIAEVYAPLRHRLREIAALIVVLILGGAGGMWLVWRQHNLLFYKERSVVAEALRESEENLAMTLHAIGDAVIATNAACQVTRMNPAAERLTGWLLAEAAGRPLPEVFHLVNAQTLQPVVDPARHALERGKAVGMESHTMLISRDGTEYQIADSAAPIRDNTGQIIGVVMVFYDITERVRLEEEVHRSREQAEAANKAKSVFLSIMSHELRTPLNAILGFSRLMRDEKGLSGDHRKTLDIINHSGEQLLNLINDVLDMSKIEAGQVDIENVPFDLGEMVRAIINLMRMRAEAASLRLLLDPSSEFPRLVRTDGTKLRQVLINLVGNAIKFTRAGEVSLRLVSHPADTPQRLLLTITVRDTGVGISAEDQKRIFEPFFQGAQSDIQKGTGLGLSITRKYVELMGGRISVESAPGKGTVFHVEIPVERVGEAEVETASVYRGRVASLAPGQPHHRILIVEDQVMNWLLLQRILNGAGFQTRMTEDGASCVELFKEWRPHLIWMDVRMKGMDGLEATRRIRTLEGGREVKIVALTASAFKKERDDIMASGMDDFIRKPYRPEEIFDCLTRHLGVRFVYEDTPPVAAPLAVAPMKEQSPDGDILDLAAARRTAGHDDKLLRVLVTLFRDQYPLRLDEMRAGKDSHCADGARRAAHTLRGMAEILGGRRLPAMALEAEKECVDGKLDRLEEWIGNLRAEAESLAAALEAALR